MNILLGERVTKAFRKENGATRNKTIPACVEIVLTDKITPRDKVMVHKNEVVRRGCLYSGVENGGFAETIVFVPNVLEWQRGGILVNQGFRAAVGTVIGDDDFLWLMGLHLQAPEDFLKVLRIIVGGNDDANRKGVVRNKMLMRMMRPEAFPSLKRPSECLFGIDIPCFGVLVAKYFKEITFSPEPAEVLTACFGRNCAKAETVDVNELEVRSWTACAVGCWTVVVKDVARGIVEVQNAGFVETGGKAGKIPNEIFLAGYISVAEVVKSVFERAGNRNKIRFSPTGSNICHRLGSRDIELQQAQGVFISTLRFGLTDKVREFVPPSGRTETLDAVTVNQADLIALLVNDFALLRKGVRQFFKPVAQVLIFWIDGQVIVF